MTHQHPAGRALSPSERPNSPSAPTSSSEALLRAQTGAQSAATQYRHRTPEVEAIQWTGHNADALRAFAGPDFDEIELADRIEDPDQTAAVRESKHGTWRGLAPGDWVVRLDGGLYEFSAEDFAEQYEPAPADTTPPADRAAEIERLRKEHTTWQRLGQRNLERAHEENARLRAEQAATLERIREVVRRLAAHAVGFQDVLDDSDRGPWGKTVAADIAELRDLAAAARPDDTTRSALLTEMEQRVRQYARDAVHPDYRAAYAAVANDLRGLAAETPQPKRPPMDPAHILGIDAGPQPETQDAAEAFTPPAHYRRDDGVDCCVHTIPVGPDSCTECRDLNNPTGA